MSHQNQMSQSGRATRAGLNTPVANVTPSAHHTAELANERRSSRPARKGRIQLKSHAEHLYGRLAYDARAIVPQLRRRADRRRVVSQQTTDMRLKYVLRMLKILLEEGFQLRSIHDLGERHVRRVMLWMVEADCSRKYMVSFFTQIRHFFEEGLQKKGALRPVTHYIGEGVISPINATVSRAISSQRDEDGNALDPEEFIRRAHAHDERAGLCCELALYLGMRFNETLSLQPHACQINPDRIYVRAAGAKNGREREIELDRVPSYKAKALATIEKMKLLCPKPKDTIFQGVSLQIAQQRLRETLNAIGLNRKCAGATFHGFRHEWMQASWREAGFVVPLDGPALPHHTTIVQLGLQVVTKLLTIESAGHSDHHKCGAYLGGHYRQLQRAGVSKRKLGRAYELVADLPYGDVRALERRRAELLAIEAGEATLEALEVRIADNYLAGTQHRRPMSRTLQFSANPSAIDQRAR